MIMTPGGDRWFIALHKRGVHDVTPVAIAGPFDGEDHALSLADWVISQHGDCHAAAIRIPESAEASYLADAPLYPGTSAGLRRALNECGWGSS